jgi:long-subunit fatty acid transport protein
MLLSPPMRRRLAATAIAIAALAPAPGATASPLTDPFLGGVVFTGPTHAHPTAFYHNPAALGLDPGTHLYLAGTLRLDQQGIERAPVDDDGAPGGGTDPGDVDNNLLTPGGFTGVYSDFNGGRVTLGIAVYTPYAERFMPDEQPVRYHTLGGYHYDLTVTPAVTFRVNNKLIVGFGVSVIPYSELKLKFARDTALEAGSAGLDADCGGARCGAENPAADQIYDVDVASALNIGFNMGFVITLKSGWYIGAGYVSPTSGFGKLFVEANGTVRVTGAERDGGGDYQGRARVTYKLPQTVQAGVRGPLTEDWELVATARLHHAGRHEEWDLRMYGGNLEDAGVPEWYPRYRGLRSVVGLEAGVEAPERTNLRLGARLRFETGGIGEERLAANQIYGLNLGVATGLEARITEQLALSLGYAFVFYPGGSATPGSFDPVERVRCVDDGYPIDECQATREGRGIPTAAGDYSRLQHAFSLGMRFDWF